jgi:16S rRNA (uracil1498-N3)-methyltransferase
VSAPGEVAWASTARARAHVLVDGELADRLVVDGADGHHLARARRLHAGEIVTAADGAGRWREYRTEEVGKGSVTLGAVGAPKMEPTLTPPLTVAFALTKNEKPEMVIARLTELGVDRIAPLIARRSVMRWDDERARVAAERHDRAAREAAMQSRRARLPVVDVAAGLETVAGHPGVVVADARGGTAESLPDPGPSGWLLVVGPEGGLDDAEIDLLAAAPRLGLGPHVLRAETAAIAGAAALTPLRRPVSPGQVHGG